MPHNTISSSPGRRIFGRAQENQIQDPYQTRQKLDEPSACAGCGAIYHHGRWQWGRAPEGAHQVHCPACRRIDENLPAGIVTLRGAFATRHKTEIVRLAHHEEAAEKGEHPLNRIMGITETPDGLEITTTDIHLPRRLGTAVKRALDGDLVIHFDEAGYFVRVDWHRA